MIEFAFVFMGLLLAGACGLVLNVLKANDALKAELKGYRTGEQIARTAADLVQRTGMRSDEALSMVTRAMNSGPYQTKQRRARLRR